MSLIEEYYELNEAEDVTGMWKVLMLAFYLLAGCVGLWCGYTLAVLRKRFEDKCYLFTEVKVSRLAGHKVDTNNINWSTDALCDFSQYSMVSSFIVATIWATFYLMCGKGGKSTTGLPQPWRIVCPSLVFNFMYFLLTLGAAINIQNGTDRFCGKRKVESRHGKTFVEYCLVAEHLLNKEVHVAKFQLDVVTKTSWGCTASWFVLFLLAFFRIIFVVDFQMYKICVFKIGDTVKNEREEILKITTYEEPHKQRLQDEKNKKVSFYPRNEEDSEVNFDGRKTTTTLDKKMGRQTFTTAPNFSSPPKTYFYMTADIRNLTRDNKRKKVSKNLDEAFGEEGTKRQIDLRLTPSLDEIKPFHRYKIDSVMCFSETGRPDFYSSDSRESDSEKTSLDYDALSYDQETYKLVSKKYV